MKIGIFGSYNYASIGDHAILEGILRHFRQRNKTLSVVIFSFHPPSTESMLISHEGVKITSAAPSLSAVLTEKRWKDSHRRNEREKKARKQRVKELLRRYPQL